MGRSLPPQRLGNPTCALRHSNRDDVIAIGRKGCGPSQRVLRPKISWQPVNTRSPSEVSAREFIASDLESALKRLPDLPAMLGTQNILSMVASLAIVKTLHELGHAVACKHFGGECNRLRVMFLLFAPALYCDVSDFGAEELPLRWGGARVADGCFDLKAPSLCHRPLYFEDENLDRLWAFVWRVAASRVGRPLRESRSSLALFDGRVSFARLRLSAVQGAAG